MTDSVFTISDMPVENRYDIEKFMPFIVDCFDVLTSPFLDKLKTLPVWRNYVCLYGYKEIDMISDSVYGTMFLAPLIQIYNDTMDESFDDNTVLQLFNMEDLEALYTEMVQNDIDKIAAR